jgi:HD superfamily phosphohydrolase
MNLGIATDFDSSRMIKLSAVINNQLCYQIKSLGCVRGIFDIRHDLFSTYYLHKTSQAIDLMFSDALVQANPYYNFWIL